jgi:beta-lactamase regulating signal transducer with metallopeptidase domain
MLAWMIWAMVPALALCAAALLAEQAARQRRTASRWVWLAALIASLLFPVLGPALPVFAAARLPTTAFPAALRAAQALAPAPASDVLARGLWLMVSAATLAVLAAAGLALRQRARSWRRLRLDGTLVRVAPSAGPAVFGWWRPEIVLPEWLASAPPRQRALAIAHEQSHLDAGDPRLVALAFVLLAIMPWNLPLWWQLHRLRWAIEVDCDQRVLRAGGDLVDYGETLIELSQRQFRQVGLMAATSPPLSFLERRIRIMSSQPNRWSRPAAVALAALAIGVVAVAAELTPPAGARAPAVLAANHASPPAVAHPDESQMDEATLNEAKEAAESAAEEAAEAKQDAEEAEAEAHEAMRDAEQQLKEATAAKRQAEAAEAEAQARKREAEATVHP